MASRAIGIDFGTTFSSVAVFENGHVEVIRNKYSNRSTPSCVSFTENGDTLVGEAALEQKQTNPTNTFSEIKRLIGRRITDSSVKKDMQRWPFKVVADDGDDKPLMEIMVGATKKRYTAEEISSMILAFMKKTAEIYLGHQVSNVVITSRVQYDAAQRRATVSAAKLAGFETVNLISEPTTHALAYDIHLCEKNETALVFYMGGANCAVVVLEVNKSTAVYMHLGGKDLDDCLTEYFADEYRHKHGANLRTDPKAVSILKKKCEDAKRALSEYELYTLEIDNLFQGENFVYSLRREKFEEICKPVIDKVLRPVEQALKNADLDKHAIDKVILTGKLSRVPKIQQVVNQFFDGMLMRMSFYSEAKVRGAAIMAAELAVPEEEDAIETPSPRQSPPLVGIPVQQDVLDVLNNNNDVQQEAMTPAALDRIVVGDYYYDPNDSLGQGAFGKVYRGYSSAQQEQRVAIKVVSKRETPLAIPEEARIQQQLHHENLVRLLQIEDTPRHLYLVMEYCQTDLVEYLPASAEAYYTDSALLASREAFLCDIVRQLASGLQARKQRASFIEI